MIAWLITYFSDSGLRTAVGLLWFHSLLWLVLHLVDGEG